VDFVEICNVCTRKVIIKAVKRIFISDKSCGSYCDFYFGVTFLEHTVDFRPFCSCDLDLDPMIFIYEPDPYSLEIYPVCKYELPTSILSKVIV